MNHLGKSSDTNRLVTKAAGGDEGCWRELVSRYEGRMLRMVTYRMDPRMRSRVDAADVVQESLMEAWKCLHQYMDQQKVPFYVWLRSITSHRLLAMHRFHLGTKMRNAKREVRMFCPSYTEATSAALAAQLVGAFTQPSQAAMRAEMKIQLENALNVLVDSDREILVLRHVEQLTNAETAHVLDLSISAASKRYIRAVDRLRRAIDLNETDFR